MNMPKPARALENNFGAIRLFAALLVIYGHGLDMKGLPVPVLWGSPISLIGLFTFFSVSGYLIYDSWLRNPHFGSFLLKRALRIFPGLIVCILVTIFVIGAIATTLPLRVYFGHHVTWQYLQNVVLFLRLYLPGVFAGRLLYHAVNGSLWSLFPEVLCYLLVPLVCLAAVWARDVLLLAIMAACGAGAMYMFAYNPTGYGLIYSADPKYVLMLVPFFMAGAFWRQLQVRIATLFRLDLAVAFAVAAFVLPMVLGESSTPFLWLLFPYVIIAVGRESSPVLREAARFGDLSYGAYLYAFPIQQLVLDHVHAFAISIATVATLAAAMLSWHLVEHPALRLKPRSGWRSVAELGLASTVATPVLVRKPRDWRAIGRSALHLVGTTALLPGIVTLLCLAAYAGQLALGRWQLDEYVLFTSLRAEGWQAIMPRLAFSPRPFSEALLFLYGTAVLAFGSPLVIPFLAALWVGVLGCAVLAARRVLPPSPGRWLTAAVLAGAPFAFVLATNSITEVFYWPMAAAAYLPTAGSAMVLLFLLSGPLDTRARLGCGVALLVAAGSSEVGAAMAVGFAGAAICAGVLGGRVRLVQTLHSGIWWLLPALLGLAVLGIVAAGRAHGVRLGAGAEPWAGNLVASTKVGLRAFLLDFAAMNTPDRTVSLAALATKLLFALGFAAVWRQAGPAGTTLGRWHAVLAASLGTAALFSIVAAYDHYGMLCCERQATTRSWLIDILIILAMAWALAWFLPWRRMEWLAPVLLAVSLYPVLYDLHGLRQDYAGYQWGIDARVRTWQSAAEAGTGPMEFYMSPDGADLLIHGYTQPIGTYAVGPDAPELVTAVGRFFGKDAVVTCQPWQTHQSWVIDGQFIPACPPNTKPPRVAGSTTR